MTCAVHVYRTQDFTKALKEKKLGLHRPRLHPVHILSNGEALISHCFRASPNGTSHGAQRRPAQQKRKPGRVKWLPGCDRR